LYVSSVQIGGTEEGTEIGEYRRGTEDHLYDYINI